jgi:undecaprenyl pyrophosphate synthase
MEPSKAAMKAALRVLTALSERQEPDPADIDELHWYVPSDGNRPLDELVCDAIQRALQDREQQRKTAKEQLRERALGRQPRPQKAPAEQRPHVQQREESRREYLTLTSKLRELGTALQQAAATLSAVDLNRNAVDSDAAKKALETVGQEVDLSGVIQLLNDHARLTRQLSPEPQKRKPTE